MSKKLDVISLRILVVLVKKSEPDFIDRKLWDSNSEVLWNIKTTSTHTDIHIQLDVRCQTHLTSAIIHCGIRNNNTFPVSETRTGYNLFPNKNPHCTVGVFNTYGSSIVKKENVVI